jgi:hypothetical protein
VTACRTILLQNVGIIKRVNCVFVTAPADEIAESAITLPRRGWDHEGQIHAVSLDSEGLAEPGASVDLARRHADLKFEAPHKIMVVHIG